MKMLQLALSSKRFLWPGFVVAFSIWSASAKAQAINVLFPPGAFGYDKQLGVTVTTRARPTYEPAGVQVGSFIVHPQLDESLFYNSNINTTPNSGSWGLETAASVAAASVWSRNSLSGTIGLDRHQFFSLPNENYTDWNVGASAGYTIADGQLLFAYAHQSYHQLATTIATVRSDLPVLNQTDTGHVEYTFNLGRFEITPDLSASAYRYGSATIGGVNFNQDYLDRNVIAGGATAHYPMSDAGGVLVVFRASESSFTTPQFGQPSTDYRSFSVLGGIDYQAVGLWRYRLLAGVEARMFAAAQYGTHIAPDIESSVIWTPTPLTTLTTTVASSIQAPQFAGTPGYNLTQANLVIDYEYRRNLLLQVRGGLQRAASLQGGGIETNLNGAVSATWLINRNVRLALGYSYTIQSGSIYNNIQNVAFLTSTQYIQNLVTLAVHLAL